MNMGDKPQPVPKKVCTEPEEKLHGLNLDPSREKYVVEDKGVEDGNEERASPMKQSPFKKTKRADKPPANENLPFQKKSF